MGPVLSPMRLPDWKGNPTGDGSRLEAGRVR